MPDCMYMFTSRILVSFHGGAPVCFYADFGVPVVGHSGVGVCPIYDAVFVYVAVFARFGSFLEQSAEGPAFVGMFFGYGADQVPRGRVGAEVFSFFFGKEADLALHFFVWLFYHVFGEFLVAAAFIEVFAVHAAGVPFFLDQFVGVGAGLGAVGYDVDVHAAESADFKAVYVFEFFVHRFVGAAEAGYEVSHVFLYLCQSGAGPFGVFEGRPQVTGGEIEFYQAADQVHFVLLVLFFYLFGGGFLSGVPFFSFGSEVALKFEFVFGGVSEAVDVYGVCHGNAPKFNIFKGVIKRLSCLCFLDFWVCLRYTCIGFVQAAIWRFDAGVFTRPGFLFVWFFRFGWGRRRVRRFVLRVCRRGSVLSGTIYRGF